MSSAFEESKKKRKNKKLFLGGHMENEAWANLHMAQSPTARGERNRLNTSIKCTSFTCRNTKLSVTQHAAGPSPWTPLHLISHPLWARAFKMCATFIPFTPLIGCAVCADYKSCLTHSFFIWIFKQNAPFFFLLSINIIWWFAGQKCVDLQVKTWQNWLEVEVVKRKNLCRRLK